MVSFKQMLFARLPVWGSALVDTPAAEEGGPADFTFADKLTEMSQYVCLLTLNSSQALTSRFAVCSTACSRSPGHSLASPVQSSGSSRRSKTRSNVKLPTGFMLHRAEARFPPPLNRPKTFSAPSRSRNRPLLQDSGRIQSSRRCSTRRRVRWINHRSMIRFWLEELASDSDQVASWTIPGCINRVLERSVVTTIRHHC